MAVQDNLDYLLYKSKGGTLSFDEWMNAGKPPASGTPPGTPTTPSRPLSPNVSGTVTPTQPAAPTYNAPPNDPFANDLAEAENQAQALGGGDQTQGAGGGAGDPSLFNPFAMPTQPPPQGTRWQWDGMQWQPVDIEQGADPELTNPKQMPATSPPTGFHWDWDGKKWSPVKDEAGETRQKRSRQFGAPDKYTDAYGRIWTWDDYEGYQETGYDKTQDTRLTEKDKGISQPSGEIPKDRFGRSATWDATDGEWRYPPDWDVDPKGEEKGAAERATKEAEDRRRWEAEQKRITEESAFRRQQSEQDFGLQTRQFDYQQRQDAARMQAEKESRLANLRASPASWLQYSLEANQTPVIQPWQKPLMPQQYGNLNVGQPIPGWQGLNQGSANLPELTTPSTQYFARIGPTAQQQWGGYQQMQSGAPIDESMFRLQSQSAPGGRNQGLSWLR